MKNLRWLMCAVALSVVGCGGAPMEEDEALSEGIQEGQVSQAAATCTETWGECRVGRCELGALDTFQILTTTCCDAAGACTTTRRRVCGC
ncbi:hypothetical protein [Myxococcus landrumensis]|uniref:Lipoprotein n=1 Tax=Myxococcus landrumensis TaxID=2813577 RepID=A0ABX7N8A3_9BACT|nr:hypothetical protein [Myxococcus landrumus]QSQ13882.1 hypothetical protein JY572_37105 [Myxococcus landrumus]